MKCFKLKWLIALFFIVFLFVLVTKHINSNAANTRNNTLIDVSSQISEEGNNTNKVEQRRVNLISRESSYQQLDYRQIGKDNTTYIINSDVDLKGHTVTIPDNCILRFESGSLRNGVIIGQNTIIEASPKQIFSGQITVKGTWCIDKAFVEWFGCKAINKYNKMVAINNASAIQRAVSSFKNVTFGTNANANAFYYVSVKDKSEYVIKINEPVTLTGINQVSTQIVYVGEQDIPVFYLSKNDVGYVFGSRYTKIQNMCIRGFNDKCRNGTGIFVEYGVANVVISDLYLSYFNECIASDSWGVSINRCQAEVSNIGFHLGIDHGGLPAMNLTRCTTDYCNTAFSLKGVFNSSMINCSSDHCVLSWDIRECIGLSLTTIGAEHCKRFMNINGPDCRNIRVSNSFVCVYKNDVLSKEDWDNYVCVGEKARNVFFENVDFEMGEPASLSSIKKRDLHFINVKGPNSKRQSFVISNSYCNRGDISEYIANKGWLVGSKKNQSKDCGRVL